MRRRDVSVLGNRHHGRNLEVMRRQRRRRGAGMRNQCSGRVTCHSPRGGRAHCGSGRRVGHGGCDRDGLRRQPPARRWIRRRPGSRSPPDRRAISERRGGLVSISERGGGLVKRHARRRDSAVRGWQRRGWRLGRPAHGQPRLGHRRSDGSIHCPGSEPDQDGGAEHRRHQSKCQPAACIPMRHPQPHRRIIECGDTRRPRRTPPATGVHEQQTDALTERCWNT